MAISHELQLGKAGEYRVILELLLRGHSPALVCCDNGVDIVLENGKKIQVKTSKTQQTCKSKYSPYYAFGLKHGKCGLSYEYNFDYIVAWVIPSNDFYIIPTKECKQVKTLCINIKDRVGAGRRGEVMARFSVYKNNWNLLNTEVNHVVV